MVLQVCLGFMRGERDVSHDLAQEVFINTWNALDKFKGESSYKTWIYRIAVNTCLKFIRDRKDKNNVPIEAAHQHTTDDSIATENSHQSLYQAVGKLNEVDRLIMMMVLDELDYDEIANVIGISPANLRVKIHRIKKQLKEILSHG